MGHPWEVWPIATLILLFTCLFTAAFARQSFLHALLFARLQVEGVPLDLLDDVFLLHFALEPAQGILEGFALLESYFCQTENTPKPVPLGRDSYCKVLMLSQGVYAVSCR
jgi:hypothetical protein